MRIFLAALCLINGACSDELNNPQFPEEHRRLMSEEDVERATMPNVLEVLAREGIALPDVAFAAMEDGTAPLIENVAYPFKHRNGSYQVPEGTLGNIENALNDDTLTDPSLPLRLRRFEALLHYRMYDPNNRIHRQLKREYFSAGGRTERASSQRCQACVATCRLVGVINTNTSQQFRAEPDAAERTGCKWPETPECAEEHAPQSYGGGSVTEASSEVRCDAMLQGSAFRAPARCLEQGCAVRKKASDTRRSQCHRTAAVRLLCETEGPCDGVELQPAGYDTGMMRGLVRGEVDFKVPWGGGIGADNARNTHSIAEVDLRIGIHNWFDRSRVEVPTRIAADSRQSSDNCADPVDIGCGARVSNGGFEWDCGVGVDFIAVACKFIRMHRDRSPRPLTTKIDAYTDIAETQDTLVLDGSGQRAMSVGNLSVINNTDAQAHIKTCLSPPNAAFINGTRAVAGTRSFSLAQSNLARLALLNNPANVPVQVEMADSDSQQREHGFVDKSGSVAVYCGECAGADCRFSTDDAANVVGDLPEATEVTELGCTNDVDCEEGMICGESCSCEVSQLGCVENADCPDEEICMAGACGPPECTDDNDCHPEQRCTDGRCVEGNPVECMDDAGCPDGETCMAGACQASECSDGNWCPDHQRCIDGRCEERGAAQCGPGLPPCPGNECCGAEMCHPQGSPSCG